MRICFCIFLFFFMSACITRDIAGIYSNQTSPIRFVIKADSTFEFKYHSGFQYLYSSGKWRVVKGKNIALQSFLKDKIIKLDVSEDIETGGPKYRRRLNIESNMADDEKKYYRYLIFTNNKLVKIVACDSAKNILLDRNFDNILFKITADQRMPSRLLDTLMTERYVIKNKNVNELNIKLKYQDSLFNYKVFNNAEIKQSERGIVYNKLFISRQKSGRN